MEDIFGGGNFKRLVASGEKANAATVSLMRRHLVKMGYEASIKNAQVTAAC